MKPTIHLLLLAAISLLTSCAVVESIGRTAKNVLGVPDEPTGPMMAPGTETTFNDVAMEYVKNRKAAK